MADTTYILKLRRAREHFGAFNEAVQWWLEDKPYRVAEEIDAQSDTKEFVVRADRQPPERLALMLGDAVQNFRSALDYLIGDLARSNVGPLEPAVERQLQFPITTGRPEFKRAFRDQGRLACVPLRAAAVIQKMQPYRRGQDPKSHPLWVLHQLSNIDKHRRIHLLMSVVKSVQYDSIQVGNVNSLEIGGGGPFKDKAVLLSHSPADADVDVNLGAIKVGIAFGEGSPASGDPAEVMTTVTAQIGTAIITPLAAYL